MSLPLLKGHFTTRGLTCASFCTISTFKTRDAFIEQWKRDFIIGSLIILSCYETSESKMSMRSIIIGAVDRLGLESKIEKLRRCTDEVKFSKSQGGKWNDTRCRDSFNSVMILFIN